jgi:hypothetical protein
MATGWLQVGYVEVTLGCLLSLLGLFSARGVIT